MRYMRFSWRTAKFNEDWRWCVICNSQRSPADKQYLLIRKLAEYIVTETPMDMKIFRFHISTQDGPSTVDIESTSMEDALSIFNDNFDRGHIAVHSIETIPFDMIQPL